MIFLQIESGCYLRYHLYIEKDIYILRRMGKYFFEQNPDII